MVDKYMLMFLLLTIMVTPIVAFDPFGFVNKQVTHAKMSQDLHYLLHNHQKLVHQHETLLDKYSHLMQEKETSTHSIHDKIGEVLVRMTTSALPKFDSVGHHVLHANEVLVSKILDNQYLDLETKKQVILWVINIAKHGDEMGSHILDWYSRLIGNVL
jgi:hypothetical protein